MSDMVIRKFTNAVGRTTEVTTHSDPFGDYTTTTCSYSKEHPMHKKLGITQSKLRRFKDTGNRFYSLEGDVFGKRFKFESDIFNLEKTPLQQTKEFATKLINVRKYKYTKTLEQLIDVIKHVL